MPSGRLCGQQDGDAGRRAHGAVTPNNGMPQLSAALTQFMWTTLVEQPVLLSVTVRAQCSRTCENPASLQTQRLAPDRAPC